MTCVQAKNIVLKVFYNFFRDNGMLRDREYILWYWKQRQGQKLHLQCTEGQRHTTTNIMNLLKVYLAIIISITEKSINLTNGCNIINLCSRHSNPITYNSQIPFEKAMLFMRNQQQRTKIVGQLEYVCTYRQKQLIGHKQYL